jgi:lipopolysaccharide/colanic/teichoic acid biosynthesis glycosyltransferase
VPRSKRLFDLLAASLGLVLLSPLLGITALLVAVYHGRPVLFRQVRPGLNSRLFTVYKFRTMNEARDAQGRLLPDADRLTGLGRFLRSTSLDELPELFNVLVGQMSLVGPRPLFKQYLERYSPAQARRHEVLPGITGWAQINGRNVLTWDEKFRLDVWYVDHWSFWLDLKILLLTLWKVLKREGISQPGHATAEEFMGSDLSKGARVKGSRGAGEEPEEGLESQGAGAQGSGRDIAGDASKTGSGAGERTEARLESRLMTNGERLSEGQIQENRRERGG